MFIPDESYERAVEFGWWEPGDGPGDYGPHDPDHLCPEWITETTVTRRCRRPANDGHKGHNAGTGVTWWLP